MIDRIQGCLFGLACGDALGYPTEFMDLDSIRERYGSRGIQELPQPALFSDDTQMTLAVARALCQAGNADVEGIAAAMAEEFVEWSVSAENNRSPGRTCMAACRRLREGIDWKRSGDRDSKGCGANMRVAPIALYYCGQPDRVSLVARLSALLTHAHPVALATAEATALCVHWALQGLSPETYLNRLEQVAQNISWDSSLGNPWGPDTNPAAALASGWNDLLTRLRRLPAVLAERPDDYCGSLGSASVADEALACALYCVLSHPNDYVSVVRLGANASGDSDSIACIAGAISGAFLGEEAIPLEWRTRIEKADVLRRTALCLLNRAPFR